MIAKKMVNKESLFIFRLSVVWWYEEGGEGKLEEMETNNVLTPQTCDRRHILQNAHTTWFGVDLVDQICQNVSIVNALTSSLVPRCSLPTTCSILISLSVQTDHNLIMSI